MWKYSLLFLALFLAVLFSLATAIDPNFIQHVNEAITEAISTDSIPK